MGSYEAVPFWCVNVPRDQWPAECPNFLADAGDKDRRILGTRDEDYHVQMWPEIKDIIKQNRIDLFQRVPSELRKYRGYTAKLKKQYGSVMDFVLQERLKWSDLTPASAPFENPNDYKILYNDWPYGVEAGVVHLVVWTKFDLKEDPATDDLTPEARKQIDGFVSRAFGTRVAPENVIWFKNWASLKSIRGVEHFHVMLYKPDMSFVEEITHGDVPLAAKVGIINEI